jgi:hypothetical protein
MTDSQVDDRNVAVREAVSGTRMGKNPQREADGFAGRILV